MKVYFEQDLEMLAAMIRGRYFMCDPDLILSRKLDRDFDMLFKILIRQISHLNRR